VRSAVKLKSGREKSVLRRHPWIFSGAIDQVFGEPEPGETVAVVDSREVFLAWGYYNPHSQIAVRILSWDQETRIGEAFWARGLKAAIARREVIGQEGTTAYRLVHAEADGLPGLIVDRYGEYLVLQALTAGIERWKATIVDALVSLVSPRGIYERSDVYVREREGLEFAVGVLAGEKPPAQLVIREHGYEFVVDVIQGHKTGFYLDQRENRRRVARYCRGKQVLNGFSYTGGFAVYAAAAGAQHIVNLDSSAAALALAERNLRLNGLSAQKLESVEGNAFEVLRQFRDQGRRFDVVILDPPKFAFTRRQVSSALRGYKDINLLGLKLVRSGGVLCTFSCSGLVSEDLFQKVLMGAAMDAGREVRVLERLGQGIDHPVLLTFPESAYLKGFICRVE